MSNKTIILADSSYTIRRIVELSFSEEKDIRLFTFENSMNLREKLLEIRPEIVLVDIKLPEFSGYEVCRFIQETPSLRNTKVFLLKGGFEPIDENQLIGRRYVDIITKPFDSNALVTTIKKLLDEMPSSLIIQDTPPPAPRPVVEEFPTSLPEDLAEIEELPAEDNDISFLDIKEEIDSSGPIHEEFASSTTPYSDDDILPSDEITRPQPEKDSLSPSLEDVDDNPFDDDIYGSQDSLGSLGDEDLNIRRNIEIQEKELEIGSLTLEELNIKKNIDDIRSKKTETPLYEDDFGGLGEEPTPGFHPKEEDTSELFPGMKQSPSSMRLPGELEDEPEEDFLKPRSNLSFVDEAEESLKMSNESVDDLFAYPEPKTQPQSIESQPMTDDENLFGKEPEMPDIKYDHDFEQNELMNMEPPQDEEYPKADFQSEKFLEEDFAKGNFPKEDFQDDEFEPASFPQDEFAREEFPQDKFPGDDFVQEEFTPVQRTQPEPFAEEQMKIPSMPIEEEPDLEEIPSMDDFNIDMPKKNEVAPEQFQFIGGYEPSQDEIYSDDKDLSPLPVETEEEPAAGIEEEQFAFPGKIPQMKPQPASMVDEFEPEELPADEPMDDEAPTQITSPTQLSEEVLRKIEDRLTKALKEMLWEIVPPLAEKIIKEEIRSIKEEVEKSLK